MSDHFFPFDSLIDVQKWQEIQDNFSLVTDVSLKLVDNKGKFITKPSREPRLCTSLLMDSPAKKIICGAGCLPTFLGGRSTVDRNLSYVCHHISGLHNFVAPLTLNEKAVGYFILGPVIVGMRRPKEEYIRAAEILDLNLEDLWSALLEIKVASLHSLRSLVELVKDLGEYVLKLSYQNRVTQKEILVSTELPKLVNFMKALLDVAFEISGADVGSVMFLDKDSKELTIKASKGIPQDIVRNTKVKVGRQVSGIAVKEDRAFLIDGNNGDNRIKRYLKRPQVSSSMVIPLKIEDRVVGVMNIGALNTSLVRFSPNNLKLMNRLLDLASLAIRS